MAGVASPVDDRSTAELPNFSVPAVHEPTLRELQSYAYSKQINWCLSSMGEAAGVLSTYNGSKKDGLKAIRLRVRL